MTKKLPQCVGRQKRGDGRGAEFDSLSGCSDAPAKFIVVGKIVQQCFEAADGFEVTAAKRQRRTQSEVQSSLEKPCAQHARHKVGADAQCFQSGAEGRASDSTGEAGPQSPRSVWARR